MKRSILMILALTLSATSASADRYSDCDQSENLEPWIRGCTQIIERGQQETKSRLVYAYYKRGMAYGGMGEHDRAIADFTQSIKLAPLAKTYFARGNAYVGKRAWGEAWTDFVTTTEIGPKHADAYYMLGNLALDGDDKQRAIIHFRKVLEIEPSHQGTKEKLKKLGATVK